MRVCGTNITRAAIIVLAVLAATISIGCSDDVVTAHPTISPVSRQFADVFRLAQVMTPEQGPETPIVRISGATWEGDLVAIADVSEANAKIFDHEGSLVAVVGRRGEGPGEFRGPRFPAIHDGHLYVADDNLVRISVWTLDGALDQEIQVEGNYIADFAMSSDGRFVLAGSGFGHSGDESFSRTGRAG